MSLPDATPLSVRARAVEPFHVMRILARARELQAAGRSILHLEVGEPDFPAPPTVLEAARRALEKADTRYTPAAGLPALREAIAAYYGRRYGVGLDPGRVLVTPGASGALQLALLALADPGERVMLADPGYPCHRQVARALGIEPVAVPIGPESGWKLTREVAEAAWRPGIGALLVATPSNPVGSVMSDAGLADLLALCRAKGCVPVVDEIYQGLTYGVPDQTVLALDADAPLVVNSCSKYFGMTGWRVGWVVAPADSVGALERLAQNLFIAAGTLSQHAACAAFEPKTEGLLAERRAIFQARRDVLLGGLAKLGFEAAGDPAGAFYIYARMPDAVATDSMTYAALLLEEAGVAVAPGGDFGVRQADRFVRFAYTRPECELKDALDRIAGHLSAM